MARLTIEQIRAPDLSVASQATARAGEAFQRGMSSASDLLSQYQEGLESQGDAELTNLLAGAKNEDEWNSIIASTDFSNMNLSAGMRQQIIDRRDNVLGYEQARATRRGTDATTANTQATTARTYNTIGLENNRDARAGDLHGVQMADHAWRQGARAEDASMAGLALAAAAEGTTNGHSGLAPENASGLAPVVPYDPSQGNNSGPRQDGGGDVQAQVYSGMIARGIPEHVAQGFMMNFQDESGFDIDITEGEANVHGTYGKGIYQLTGSRRDAFEAKYGNDYSIDNQLDFMMDELNGSERGARDAIFNTNSAGEAGAAIVSRFLRPAEEHRVSRTNRYLGSSGNTDFTRGRATSNPNAGQGPAQQAYQAALANSQYQSTSDVLAAYERQYDYNETGQAAIEQADNELAEEALAQQILDLAETNVSPTEAIVESRRTNPGATAQERLAMEAKILEQTGDGGALSAAQLQIGTTGASPADIDIANTTLTDIQERQQRDPFQFAQVAAESYVDNPVGQLQTALEGFNISTVPAELESAINQLASNEGISRAEAAYSFARAAEIDTPLVPDWSIGGDNLAQNRAAEFAREHFKGDAAATARAALSDDRAVAERIQTVTSNLGNIERKIQKLRQGGNTVSDDLLRQRDEARAQVNQFYEQYGNRGQNPNAPRAGAQPAQAQQPAAQPRNVPIGPGPRPGAGVRLEQSLRQG